MLDRWRHLLYHRLLVRGGWRLLDDVRDNGGMRRAAATELSPSATNFVSIQIKITSCSVSKLNCSAVATHGALC
jgi:hypothetical protein